MAFVCELALSGAAIEAASAAAWFDAGPAQAWAKIAGLSALDVYRPAEGPEDPYNKDDGPPLLIAVAEFASAQALEAAAPQLDLGLAGLPLATRATSHSDGAQVLSGGRRNYAGLVAGAVLLCGPLSPPRGG